MTTTTKINWNQYFTLSVDLYHPIPEIEDRLKTSGFDFTKKVINPNNGRTCFEIETSPSHMGKVLEILNQ